jgi:2'-5' RNA ligase
MGTFSLSDFDPDPPQPAQMGKFRLDELEDAPPPPAGLPGPPKPPLPQGLPAPADFPAVPQQPPGMMNVQAASPMAADSTPPPPAPPHLKGPSAPAAPAPPLWQGPLESSYAPPTTSKASGVIPIAPLPPPVPSGQPQPTSPQILTDEPPAPAAPPIMLDTGQARNIPTPQPGAQPYDPNSLSQAATDLRDLLLGPAYGAPLKADSKVEQALNGMLRATANLNTPTAIATWLTGIGVAQALPWLARLPAARSFLSQYPALAKGVDIATRGAVPAAFGAKGVISGVPQVVQGVRSGNLEQAAEGATNLALGGAGLYGATRIGTETAGLYPGEPEPPATIPARRGAFPDVMEQARPEGVTPPPERPNVAGLTQEAAQSEQTAEALTGAGRELAAEVWLRRAEAARDKLPSEPLNINGRQFTQKQTGVDRGGRPIYDLLDDAGNVITAGRAGDVANFVRSRLAPTPDTAPPEDVLNAGALESAIEEQAQRYQNIRTQQDHLASGQDVQMSADTMRLSTPEQRIAMLRENIAAHQADYEIGWKAIEGDLGAEAAGALRAKVEAAGNAAPPPAPAAAPVGAPPAPEVSQPISSQVEPTQPAPSAALDTVPETPATIATQVEQLQGGLRRVVMLPKGTPLVKRPKGMQSYQDEGGNTYFYNPTLTNFQQIDQAVQQNRLPELLGATQGGMGAPDKSQIAGPPEAVVAKDAQGETVQAALTDPGNLGPAIAQAQKVTPPGGAVDVEPPEAEIAHRLEGEPPAPGAPEKHEYSSTQVDLPTPLAQGIITAGASIPDEQLADDGRETVPHITVKFGIHGEDPAEVQKLLAEEPPVTATLGKTSIFHTDEADVLKVDVDSPDLHRLNAKIADALPHTDTHPDYKPHVTIAYLQKGQGEQYDGQDIPGVTGQTVTLPAVTFSSKNGEKTNIPLSGSPGEPLQQGTYRADELSDAPPPQGVAQKPQIARDNAEPPAPESGPHGPIFRQFHHDASSAIAKLTELQTGEAVGALHHPAVGDIDLVWGKPGHPWHEDDDGYGLSHIIAKHGDEFPAGTLQNLLDDMRPLAGQQQRDRMELESQKYHATVRLSWDHRAKKWLLTAFERTVPPSAKGRSFVPGAQEQSGETSPSPEGGPATEGTTDGSGNPVTGTSRPTSPLAGRSTSTIPSSKAAVNPPPSAAAAAGLTPEQIAAQVRAALAASRGPAPAERADVGPIADYTRGRGTLPKPDAGWWHGSVDGEPFYTNQSLALLGEAPAAKGPQASSAFAQNLKGTGKEAPIEPRAYSAASDDYDYQQGSGRAPMIWFSDGTPVNARFYDHVLKRYPDATFAREPNVPEDSGKPVYVRSGNKAVGLIAPMRRTAGHVFDKVKEFLGEETGTSRVGQVVERTAFAFYNQDVLPKLQGSQAGAKKMITGLVETVFPRFGVDPKTLDTVYALKGDRDKAEFILRATVEHMSEVLGPEADNAVVNQVAHGRPDLIAAGLTPLQAFQVDVMDRIKTGAAQETAELQNIADFLRQADDVLYKAQSRYKDIHQLANHQRVMWKVIPGSQGARGKSGQARRPLEGTKGQFKRHVFENMSDGIKLGGVPYTYNPVDNFVRHYVDVMKFLTAQRWWAAAKKMKARVFVPFGKRAPEGFDKLDDRIARSFLHVEEGMVDKGEWYVEHGMAKLMNAYVSRDLLRDPNTGLGQLGNVLMAVKNGYTAVELGISGFHWVFETLETGGSSIGLGLSKILNRGAVKEGLADIGKGLAIAPAAREAWKTGDAGVKLLKNPAAYAHTPEGAELLKAYPDAKQLMDDLFAGGGRVDIYNDYKQHTIQAFREAYNQGSYLGAGLRSLGAGMEALMVPLFEWYIPKIKVGVFLREYSEQLLQHSDDLAAGKTTRGELARKAWDFVEDRFGEMNFDNLFWHRTFKTAMQIVMRSVTWKFGSVRAGAYAVGGTGKELHQAVRDKRRPKLTPQAAWALGMALLTAAVGTLATYLFTGDRPRELKDLFYPRTDKNDPRQRVSPPTYAREYSAIAKHPIVWAFGGVSGVLSKSLEVYNNKNYYNQRIWEDDDPAAKVALKIFNHYAPWNANIGLQSFERVRQEGGGLKQAVPSFLGFPKAPRYVTETPAEELLSQYRQEAQPSGGRSANARNQVTSRFTALLRAGQEAEAKRLYGQALAAGTATPDDMKHAAARAVYGPLVADFNQLFVGVESGQALDHGIRVMAKASPAEQQVIGPILGHHLKTAFPKLPPVEQQHVLDRLKLLQ